MSIIERPVEQPGTLTFPPEWEPEPQTEHQQPTEAEQAAALLLRSADLLGEHGLAFFQTQDARGRYCTSGAIYAAHLELRSRSVVFLQARAAVASGVPRGYITAWNDRMSRLPRWLAQRIVQRKLRRVARELVR